MKLYEDFKDNLNNNFTVVDNLGDIKISKGNSYIEFHKMKDNYNLSEFTDLDLDNVYENLGDSCIFIQKVFIHPNDNTLLLRKFLNIIEEYTIDNGYDIIVTIAEPFGDKRLDVDKLVQLYKIFGFSIFEKMPHGEGYMMYKNVD